MNECLSVEKIQQMSLKELLSSEHLPDFVDASSLDNSNFEDFKYWLGFLENNSEKEDSIFDRLDKDSKDYLKAAYFSMLPLVGLHESLHAVGAELSGGTFLKFGWNSEGVYTLVNLPTTFSQCFTAWLPNFVLPLFGFYMISEGLDKKNMSYLGMGVSATLLNFGSFAVDYGDMSKVASYIVPQEYVLAVGGAVAIANYFAAYALSKKMRSYFS